MFLLHIWRYHIFPFLDKKSICKMLCTCSKFYKFPKKNKVWEYLAKQHWKNCILPKNYLKVVKYFHSLETLSIYEKKKWLGLGLGYEITTSIFGFKDLVQVDEKIDCVFYNQDKNTVIYITKNRIYILNVDIPNSKYICYTSSIFIINIIDYSYDLHENILYVVNDKQLTKINITTKQPRFICIITNIQYIIYISDNDMYCIKDNGISILNIKTMKQFDVWKPAKNKKVEYSCKPLLTPDGLLVSINNGNKLIFIEANTHISSDVYKRSFDCILHISDISDNNIFIILYKKSVEIRNSNNINEIIHRSEKIDIPNPLTKTYKYNISIIGNYSFIIIHDCKENVLYYGFILNLSNYNITNYNITNYEYLMYSIIPYDITNEMPNMLIVSHKSYRDSIIRVVYMKDD